MSGSTARSGGTGTDQGELPLDSSFIRSWIRATAADVAAHRDYLTQLDAAIGDADHGVNMDRGFTAALLALEGDEASPPGRLLEAVGNAIVFKVGGASGPLYGTAFRGAASALGDSEIFGGEDLLSALRYALEGIQRLGAAVEGDKTIVDAWVPAVSAFERELRSGGSVAGAAARAAVAAEEGARETVPMQARKGRASYLGARSVGHQDPGATSAAMLFSALGRTARERAV
ncbi:MAG TPA: dihydroxyacetone kinase subunit DhaL [Actinomycetota bacterium]|nr:dihydroxyacetone kinase subunit DhaL [Actinomycetota bacterium]